MKTSHILSALSLVAILSSSAGKDLNLPVVSKGYQHEFWQTVKMGTEAAAKSWVTKPATLALPMKRKSPSRSS